MLNPLCEATAAMIVSSKMSEPAKTTSQLNAAPSVSYTVKTTTYAQSVVASSVMYPPLAAVTRSQVTALAPLGEQLAVG